MPRSRGADTAPDVLLAHVDGLHLDALLLEDFLHLPQGYGRVAAHPGAAVNQ